MERTFKINCATKRGQCVKTGIKPSVCPMCAIDECKKWKNIGQVRGAIVGGILGWLLALLFCYFMTMI